MPALVSIAIPIFNTARFLPAALDSVLAQDHVHWEALLWDDGSTDGSGEIAAYDFDKVLGKRLTRAVTRNTQLKWSDLG